MPPELRPGWVEKLVGLAEKVTRAILETFDKYLPFWSLVNWREPLSVIHPSEAPQRNLRLLDALLAVPGLPDHVRGPLLDFRNYASKARFPVDHLMVLFGINNALEGYLAPYALVGTHSLNKDLRPARPDPLTAWTMERRTGTTPATVSDWLRESGWPEEAIADYRELAHTHLTPDEVANLTWRGRMGTTAGNVELRAAGYDPDDIAYLRALWERIPGPGDLISMAIREAFHPDLVAKYHYMDRFPPEFAEWMRKQGFSEDWARKYWVAHWALPSITAGINMFHRRRIDEAQLRDLLVTADIAPIWHDPIIATAYAPYTRVDVRRMYSSGVLTADQVYDTYRDLGYDDEHAYNLTVWTIAAYGDEEREASKADILNAYRDGAIGRDTAKGYLLELQYSDSWAEYYLYHEDLAVQRKITAAETDLIGKQYVAGEIDRTQAVTRLNALGITSTQVQRLLTEWDIQVRAKATRPTVAQLETFFKDGQIDSARYRSELLKRGYSDEYATWYIAQTYIEMQRNAAAEAERAAKEAARIAEKAVKTAYEERKATIDYDIAELREEYTNLRMLRETIMTSEQRRARMDLIQVTQVEIAALQRSIAERRTALEAANARLRALDVTADQLALITRRGEIATAIETARATIAAMRADLTIVRNAKARMELVGPAESLRAGIDETLTSIAELQGTVASLRSQIAAVQEDIATQRVTLTRQRAELRDAGIDPELLTLFDSQARLTEDMAALEVTIAAMRVELAEVKAELALLALADPATELMETRDAIALAIREDQERIAEARETVAIAEAELEAELTSEEIAAIEARMRDIQEAIRRLETERARLRIAL